MNPTVLSRLVLRARSAGIAALSWAALGLPLPASAQYAQTNLVSSVPGLAAITDPLLVNPWGISRLPTSPFWTSNQGTNSSRLYAITGSTSVSQVLGVNANGFVAIPTTSAGPQGPTGQFSNGNTASFQLTPGAPGTSARFIFADLNGTISGWAGGLNSSIQVATPGAVYTGLAIDAAGTRLYAADNAGGRIDAFDSSFAPLSLPGGIARPASSRRADRLGSAMEPGGDEFDAVFAEAVAPRRHRAAATGADRLFDVGDRAAIQPDRVAEVGCPQRRIAFAGRAVAGSTSLEQRLAECRLDRVARFAGQAAWRHRMVGISGKEIVSQPRLSRPAGHEHPPFLPAQSAFSYTTSLRTAIVARLLPHEHGTTLPANGSRPCKRKPGTRKASP